MIQWNLNTMIECANRKETGQKIGTETGQYSKELFYRHFKVGLICVGLWIMDCIERDGSRCGVEYGSSIVLMKLQSKI